MRVLITGAGGMLGQAVSRTMREAGWTVAALTKDELDVTDVYAVTTTIERERPGAVIQCAAYTNVDAAESEEALALNVNAQGAHNVAAACRSAGARFIYPSTDYVFDGAAHTPYRPDAQPHPLNAYGRSKLAGEEAARTTDDCLVVRTSWLYGGGGRNFVRTMIENMQKGAALRVVSDQIGSPTWAKDVARAMQAMIAARVPAGTYHVTSTGQTSWFDFAREIARLTHSKTPVEPCMTAEFHPPRPARRPAWSVLDCANTENLIGPLPHWQDSLRQAIASSDY